jgi:hypothetical protein
MNLLKLPFYPIILFSLILFSCTVQNEKFVPEKFENLKKDCRTGHNRQLSFLVLWRSRPSKQSESFYHSQQEIQWGNC